MTHRRTFTQILIAIAFAATVTAERAPITATLPAGRARTLAVADFNGDGLEDVAVGFDTGGRGAVVLMYANLEARIGPARVGKTAPPLLLPGETILFPVAPETLVAADLDNDGRTDLAGARLGATELVVLRGTAEGFDTPSFVPLDGTLTALVSGEVNRRDGVADLVAAVQRPDGPRLLVFEDPRGAVNAIPEVVPLDAPASLLALREVDGDRLRDIAAVSDERLTVVRGRDRRTSRDLGSRATEASARYSSWELGQPVLVLSQPLIKAGSPAADLLLHGADGSLLRYRGYGSAGPALAPGHAKDPLAFDSVVSVPLKLNGDAEDDWVAIVDDPENPVQVHASTIAATHFVTNTNDSGAGSLRQAIEDANASSGGDEIRFSIPGTPPHVIVPVSPLPPLVKPTTLDATTQPGWSGAPLIRISGSLASGSTGITIWGRGVVIRGLGINAFDRHGIQAIDGYAVIEACRVGSVAEGPSGAANADNGLDLWGHGNIVGGPGVLGNVLAGNNKAGVFLHGLQQSVTHAASGLPIPLADLGTVTSTIDVTDRSTVQDVSVTVDLTHTWDADLILTLISPEGIRVQLAANRGLDGDDYTGTTFDDQAPLPISAGVPPFPGLYQPEEPLSVLVGRQTVGPWILEITDVAAQDTGVLLSWSLDLTSVRSVRNRIENNLIGTDETGATAPVGNLTTGVTVEDCDDTEILGNTIAGHDGLGEFGVALARSNFTLFQGNRVGTDLSGTTALPNSGGVVAYDNSSFGMFGGFSPGAGNVVSGNLRTGFEFIGSSGNSILQNHVGLDATGLAPLGNLRGVVIVNGSQNNLVGGFSGQARNYIAANSTAGIQIDGGIPISPNFVRGNWIGLNVAGDPVGGQDIGIDIDGGEAITIGGNVVSGHPTAGIRIGERATATTVLDNTIGLDPTGTLPAGNGQGIAVPGAVGTIIGSSDPADGNRIGANVVGVEVGAVFPEFASAGSSDTPVALPDLSTSYSQLTVLTGWIPWDVEVTLDLTHTYVGDLSVTLISPLGTRVLLVDRRGGNGANFANTTFDDEAFNPIASASAPFSGSFIPEQPLHRLVGRPAAGVWTLEIVDNAAGDTGTLTNWSLTFYSNVDQQTQILHNRFTSNAFAVVDQGAGTLIDSNSICNNVEGIFTAGLGPRVFNNEIGECGGLPGANTATGILVQGARGSEIVNNVVRWNGGTGVRVTVGINNRISLNSIDGNAGLGIDLGVSGPDVNDYQDGDVGANHQQNAPVLLSATPIDSLSTQLSVHLNSRPGTTYNVELFGSDSFDPGGAGEGRDPLWVDTVTTDLNGDAFFSWAVPASALYWSATATDEAGNTSEFSATASIPGEASPAGDMTVGKVGGFVELTYQPACGATDHALVWGTGPIGPATVWTGAACGFGTSGSLQFTVPSPPPGVVTYFVVVGQTAGHQGSFGRNAAGTERPESSGLGSCDPVQTLAAVCP